jgi:hypothetical protein
MKRFSNFVLPVMLLSMMIMFVACSKDGPAGAKGDTGATGPAGGAGPAGPKGDTGVANVMYSPWFDVVFAPVKNTAGDTLAWDVTVPIPKLTSAILTTGEVKVYLNAGTAAAPAVFPLPLTDLFALTGVQNINMYFSIGSMYMYATDNASTFLNTSGVKVWQYRYILIPGGRPARSAVDWNNYASVQQYLGLKD